MNEFIEFLISEMIIIVSYYSKWIFFWGYVFDDN